MLNVDEGIMFVSLIGVNIGMENWVKNIGIVYLRRF